MPTWIIQVIVLTIFVVMPIVLLTWLIIGSNKKNKKNANPAIEKNEDVIE